MPFTASNSQSYSPGYLDLASVSTSFSLGSTVETWATLPDGARVSSARTLLESKNNIGTGEYGYGNTDLSFANADMFNSVATSFGANVVTEVIDFRTSTRSAVSNWTAPYDEPGRGASATASIHFQIDFQVLQTATMGLSLGLYGIRDGEYVYELGSDSGSLTLQLLGGGENHWQTLYELSSTDGYDIDAQFFRNPGTNWYSKVVTPGAYRLLIDGELSNEWSAGLPQSLTQATSEGTLYFIAPPVPEPGGGLLFIVAALRLYSRRARAGSESSLRSLRL